MDLRSRRVGVDPDLSLVDVVARARDRGVEAMLVDDPTPDGTAMVGVGRTMDIVVTAGTIQVEDGSGVPVRTQPAGEQPLRAMHGLWQEMAATQSQGDALPIALGGFAFRTGRDPGPPWGGFPTALLRVPALLFRRRRGRTEAFTVQGAGGNGADGAAGWIAELISGGRDPYRAPATTRLVTEAARPPYQWMASVDAAIEALSAGIATKVVLARELIARGDGPLHAGSVVRELRRRQPSCYVFLIPGADGSVLVGASPELLVRREKHRAVSQPMAGTAARGRDAHEDGELARTLQASEKNAREHEVVIASMEALYRTAGAASVQVAPRELLRFATVQHLASTVTAHFTGATPSALELCAALHPTAAVGGLPWPQASPLIDLHERMERGWYAGGVGWTDAAGDGAFAVTLRCGLLWEDGVRLYAGAGIMPDSTSLDELNETDVKFLALLDALRASLRTPQPRPLDAR